MYANLNSPREEFTSVTLKITNCKERGRKFDNFASIPDYSRVQSVATVAKEILSSILLFNTSTPSIRGEPSLKPN